MAWSVKGGWTTAKANQPLYWHTIFAGAGFVGPISVAANIYASNDDYGDNFGKLTVGDISVQATQGNSSEPSAYWPVSFEYFYTVTNDNDSPIVYNVAVGTF